MSKDPSIVEKSERAIDDFFGLWKRRKFMCLIIGAILVSPAVASVFGYFSTVSDLRSQVSALQSNLNTAQAELADAKRDRDAKATQLAPFLALANRRYAEAPADERLVLLSKQMDEVLQTVRDTAARLPSKRALSPDSTSRIKAQLGSPAKVKISILTTMGDTEAFALASQVKDVFEESGFEVNGVNQVVWSKPVEGIFIRAKRAPDGPLGDGILQLFQELKAKPSLATDEKMSDSELQIIVGTN
jgi:hypothetical protein